MELQLSNNEFATPSAYENQHNAVYELYHPSNNLQQRLRYREIGEVPYHREKMREAMTWILGHPAKFVRLTLLRAWYFWTAPARRPIQMVLLYIISGLAVFGLWRLIKDQPFAGMQFAALWLGFSFVYCLVQFENRYRYPIFWSLLLLAGFGLTQVSWWQDSERRAVEKWIRCWKMGIGLTERSDIAIGVRHVDKRQGHVYEVLVHPSVPAT